MYSCLCCNKCMKYTPLLLSLAVSLSAFGANIGHCPKSYTCNNNQKAGRPCWITNPADTQNGLFAPSIQAVPGDIGGVKYVISEFYLGNGIVQCGYDRGISQNFLITQNYRMPASSKVDQSEWHGITCNGHDASSIMYSCRFTYK